MFWAANNSLSSDNGLTNKFTHVLPKPNCGHTLKTKKTFSSVMFIGGPLFHFLKVVYIFFFIGKMFILIHLFFILLFCLLYV